ncbi:MAG: FAD-binding oxidoreductase [Pseudomonadota bacterium]
MGGGESGAEVARDRWESDLLSPDVTTTPYWLREHEAPDDNAGPLPKTADVVVIGSGYTGLSAALQTARDGMTTVILEAGRPGEGCSTRNGAHISTSVKPSLETLAKRYGPERASAIRAEGRRSLDWIEDFVRAEELDCDFRRSGRFHAAHSPRMYERIARSAERGRHDEGVASFAVPRSEQRAEIDTDFYHGGVVYPHFATLHPGKFHRGVLRRAIEAGADLHPHCAARTVRRDGDYTDIDTRKGVIRARDVIIATNGYTTDLIPWLQRRVIPIGSYMIATEPLALNVMDRLFPTRRLVTDTRRVVFYYGPSPDGRRIVFGGRVSSGETDPAISGPRLHAELTKIFPDMDKVAIDHSWMGFVAYSFDELAHTGTHDGIHYALGYCGSGVGMASYLGTRLGQRVIGQKEGQTAFDNLPFPTRPFYAGTPWFLSAAVAWFRWCDRAESSLATWQGNPNAKAP